MVKIFLSHNHNDKPVVEPVALELSAIFGQDEVFYDSWSIRPGDGIIAKMSEGLSAPEYVFFFVSKNSLNSRMVDLEWQNALYQATRGITKLIPVIVDGSAAPPIMMQNVYLDMFTNGVPSIVRQIVNICHGNNSFTPQHEGFQNLTWRLKSETKECIEIEIRASHLLETDVHFLFASELSNADMDIIVSSHGRADIGYKSEEIIDGRACNIWSIEPIGTTITPKKSMTFKVSLKGRKRPGDLIVLHHDRENIFIPLPRRQ